MMGERTVMQEAPFYEFSLERHVPADHLLRAIDRFVDVLRSHLGAWPRPRGELWHKPRVPRPAWDARRSVRGGGDRKFGIWRR